MKSLKYFDLALKIEVTIHELSSVLFNMSIFELYLFTIGTFCFLKLYQRMGNFWLFFPHLARGILGLILHRKVPKSHEIVKEFGFDKKTENLGFDDVH